MATPVPKLFQPIRIGTANLQHRVVLAPMNRSRADERNVLGALGLEYYKQRTSAPGTLAITEGTILAPARRRVHLCPWHLERRTDLGLETGSVSLLSLTTF